MKYLLLLIALLISATTYGQKAKDSSATKTFHRVQVGINITPEYCFRTLITDGSADAALVAGIYDGLDVPKIGFTAGLGALINLSRHVAIETGLQYANRGFKTKTSLLTFGSQYGGSGSFDSTNITLPNQSKQVFNYQYISVPVKLDVTLGQRRLRFTAGAGVIASYLYSSDYAIVTQYFDEHPEEARALGYTGKTNKIDIAPTVSAGVDFKISNRLNVKLEPVFKYSLVGIVDAPVSLKLWSAGVTAGCYFGL